MQQDQKTRRDFIDWIFKTGVTATMLSQAGCKFWSSDSSVKILSGGGSCAAGSTATMESIAARMQERMEGTSDQHAREFFGEMAKLPQPYIEYLLNSNMYVAIKGDGDLGDGVAGMCTMTGSPGQPGTEPKRIDLGASTISQNGTAIHEMGHALHSYVFDLIRNQSPGANQLDPFDLLSSTYNAVLNMNGTSEAQQMWYYPKRNVKEYWAESFSSQFCSAETLNEMKLAFPKTYEFMASVIREPGSSPIDMPNNGPLPSRGQNNNQFAPNRSPGSPNNNNVGSGGVSPNISTWQNDPIVRLLVQLVQTLQDPKNLTFTLDGVEADSNIPFKLLSPAFDNLDASDLVQVEISGLSAKDVEKTEVYFDVDGVKSTRVSFSKSLISPDHIHVANVAVPKIKELFPGFKNEYDKKRSAKLVVTIDGKVRLERRGFSVNAQHVDRLTGALISDARKKKV